MARDVAIQRAETWLYLHDTKDEVLVWDRKKPKPDKSGAPPDDDGGFFKVHPTPFELVAESLIGFGAQGTKAIDRVDKPSVVMRKIIEETIVDWRGVKHPETADVVTFEGSKSVALLPAMVVNLLGGWIYRRAMESPSGKASSASTQSKRASSGRGTRGRAPAKSATS